MIVAAVLTLAGLTVLGVLTLLVLVVAATRDRVRASRLTRALIDSQRYAPVDNAHVDRPARLVQAENAASPHDTPPIG